jgi:predicted RNase H-like HicB family nuclease
MCEHPAGVPEDAGADRADVRAALMVFGRRYLQALESQGAPMRSLGMGAWRAHPQGAGLFVPLDVRPPPSDFDEWGECRTLEALVTSRPRLRRLVTQPMYAPTDRVPDFRGLLSGIVAMTVERYEAIHGSDERNLAGLVDELADWFCRDVDPMFVAMSVINFGAPGPIPLAPGLTVRRATDDEVSAMLGMGVLNVDPNPNPTQSHSQHVDEAARWVVALNHSRPRRFGASAQPGDDPNLSALKDAADAWLAVLRVLTPANVRLGPTLTTQLVGGIASGGSWSGYGPPALFAWHNPATITPDTVATFEQFAQQIIGGEAQRLKVAHGLHRFSEASTRANPTDRLVDLVIALESMFSDGADSVSYKVSRRASAMLQPLGLSAATVYQFVRAAYSSRSSIVHGRAPAYRNLAGEDCQADEQVRELDRLVAALFRQILSSASSEKPAVTADRLISAALDLERHHSASSGLQGYDVTVTHDGNSFMAVPPGDHTSWTRGDTVEQLRDRLADVIALWTQAPCGSDQVSCELDDAAQAANS